MLARCDLSTINLEATAVEIHGALGGILVVRAYKPPKKSVLDTDFEAVLDAHRSVIVVGDLNCKLRIWNSSWTTPNGKRLVRTAQSCRASEIGPVEPTFYSSIRCVAPGVLDVAVVQGIICSVEVELPLSELISDTFPVFVDVYR